VEAVPITSSQTGNRKGGVKKGKRGRCGRRMLDEGEREGGGAAGVDGEGREGGRKGSGKGEKGKSRRRLDPYVRKGRTEKERGKGKNACDAYEFVFAALTHTREKEKRGKCRGTVKKKEVGGSCANLALREFGD